MRSKQLFDFFTLGTRDVFLELHYFAFLSHLFIATVQVKVDEERLLLEVGRGVDDDVASLVSPRNMLALVRSFSFNREQVCCTEFRISLVANDIIFIGLSARVDQPATFIADALPVVVKIAYQFHEILMVQLLPLFPSIE